MRRLSSVPALRSLDGKLFKGLNGRGDPVWLGLLRGVTELGSIWAAVGAAAVLAGQGRRRVALDALGAATATWLAGQGLKRLVARPRPYDGLAGVRLLIGKPRGTSWPSSHPAVLLSFLIVAERDLHAGPGVRMASAALAATVGMSRVALGVHYPSDVAAGAVMGWSVGAAWSRLVSPNLVGRTGNRALGAAATVEAWPAP